MTDFSRKLSGWELAAAGVTVLLLIWLSVRGYQDALLLVFLAVIVVGSVIRFAWSVLRLLF